MGAFRDSDHCGIPIFSLFFSFLRLQQRRFICYSLPFGGKTTPGFFEKCVFLSMKEKSERLPSSLVFSGSSHLQVMESTLLQNLAKSQD